MIKERGGKGEPTVFTLAPLNPLLDLYCRVVCESERKETSEDRWQSRAQQKLV